MYTYGTWIKVRRELADGISYWHHGIIASDSLSSSPTTVIHVCIEDGKFRLVETPLTAFGMDAEIVDEEYAFSQTDVFRRARALIGVPSDRLPEYPEHFAAWCVRGDPHSRRMWAFGTGCVVTGCVVCVVAVVASYIIRI